MPSVKTVKSCVPPRRSRRRRSPPPLLLLGLLLFLTGFCLGHAAAAREPAPSGGDSAAAGLNPDGPTAEPPAADAETAGRDAWNLLLVNGDHPLSRDFAPPELTRLKNGHAIDARVYPALQEMMDGARAAGLAPLICSSFRTWDKQAELFDGRVQRLLAEGCSPDAAEEQASLWVARPGSSEHQAGLAVDIVDRSYQLLDRKQEDTPVQQWLMAHCAEYGFILRYLEGKEEITGYRFEPWHYRYVGTEIAKVCMEQGLSFEEYLALQPN